MVTVIVNGEEHEVSNSVAAALFTPKPDSRVHPVTAKVTAAQKAWLVEQSAVMGVTTSTLIADMIEKEMTTNGR